MAQCHMCGQRAVYTCDECGRPVCAAHHCDSQMDIYAGACYACFERMEQIRWENYMRSLGKEGEIEKARERREKRDLEPEDGIAKKQGEPREMAAVARRPAENRLTPVVIGEFRPVPAKTGEYAARTPASPSHPANMSAPRPPQVNREYILQWAFASAFTGLMAVLVIISVQAENAFGLFVFGLLGARMVWAMARSGTVKWLFFRLGQYRKRDRSPERSGGMQGGIDLRLHKLLGRPQHEVIAYLGEPENVQDLSLRGGALPDIEIWNLEYYSKGLRFYFRQEPVVESIHYVKQGYESYASYPHEIVPGLRVGMTRREIERALGDPAPDDPWDDDSYRRWKKYRNAPLAGDIPVIEVWYEDPYDSDAIATIIAISTEWNS